MLAWTKPAAATTEAGADGATAADADADAERELVCEFGFPAVPPEEVTYFIKAAGDTVTPQDDFDKVVQTGNVRGDYLDSMVASMGKVYSPLLAKQEGWAASVQNEFKSGMNKFMSTLTETYYNRQHMTVLYVPNEDLTTLPMEELVQDRACPAGGEHADPLDPPDQGGAAQPVIAECCAAARGDQLLVAALRRPLWDWRTAWQRRGQALGQLSQRGQVAVRPHLRELGGADHRGAVASQEQPRVLVAVD